jgi:hypothetical protein
MCSLDNVPRRVLLVTSQLKALFCGVELVKKAFPLSEETGKSKSLKAAGERVCELVGAGARSRESVTANTIKMTVRT